MKRFRYALFLVVLGVPGASQASSLFTYNGLVSEMSRSVAINYAGKNMTVGAGLANVSLDGVDLIGLCVDLVHWNTNGSAYQVNVRPIEERGPTATRAAWLFSSAVGTVDTRDRGAALQLAVWDILYDGGDGLNAGSFKSSVTGNVLTITNSYLANSFGQQSSAAQYLKAVTHGDKNDENQDYMVVPEPASMAVLLTGAAAVLRRRRSKA